ncbi:hypothetical protein [Pseudogemmobacter faecipullorum]|uniref:AAA+ family ATPase n=1 Tax=Pseudogemmobacter faecipullorum TaxID=2755041 RepID=A0ABS8CGB6_9RHOB|nr:hypothetical protein [Pseudogemmobacter faecipullorum]MCB5408432.1 hypothetical protein [Pseudogemmobacter faecipullorum]
MERLFRRKLRRWFSLQRLAASTGLAFALLVTLPVTAPGHSHLRAEAGPDQPHQLPPQGVKPAPAPGAEPPAAGAEQGFSLIEEGAKLLFRGLMTEMEPALSDMDQSIRELAPQIRALGPQLSELARLVGDFRNYDMPVMLENGDILIRRNAPLPPEKAPGTPPPGGGRAQPLPGPDGQIDL